jgi:hypothetical protein
MKRKVFVELHEVRDPEEKPIIIFVDISSITFISATFQDDVEHSYIGLKNGVSVLVQENAISIIESLGFETVMVF